ncbi:hypothetical protein [Jiella pacifica]|uniref:Uncharacterized protein n=1 Tax=Jiella pacifica TaxID=2696469 RepID=A0A6N9TG35_9HYPH|nr:hypothetical protein [Jiella pacifica]NDW07828.1 hypothetical protein [Jiella pacifica]
MPTEFQKGAMQAGSELYEPFIKTEGFPQMGFSIFCRGGQRHVFFYHNLDNLDLIEQGGDEFLRFTHRGKAVTMRGTCLHEVIEAVIAHTLQAIYEHDPALYAPGAPNASVIDRIAVTALPSVMPKVS